MVLQQVHSHARHKALIKFGAKPRVLPFAGAIVERIGPTEGSVFLERRDDKLCFDGREVILDPIGRLNSETTLRWVKDSLPAGDLLCDLVLDALLRDTSLIPERWAADREGNPRFVYFLNGVFGDSRGWKFVPCLFKSGGKWSQHIAPLNDTQVHPFDYVARLKPGTSRG
ncbi:MAG TPA: hypothetical protein VG941_03175 [Candidatus Paceibacterota bacterium]|nr:hypothetical protein [Candidatus Paceibacterota bacterium]